MAEIGVMRSPSPMPRLMAESQASWHQHSPQFWLGISLVSLGVHGLCFIYLLPWITSMGASQPAVTLTPVEVVEWSDQPPSDRSAERSPRPDPVPATDSAATDPATTDPATTNPTDIPIVRSDRPRQDSPPVATERPAPVAPETPSPELPDGQDEERTPPPEESTEPEEPEVEPEVSEMEPDVESEVETPEPLPDVPDVPDPGQPDLSEEATEDPDLTTLPVGRDPITQVYGVQMMRAEVEPRSIDGTLRDLYDQPPQLRQYSDQFRDDPTTTSCRMTPDARQNLGEPVRFRVELDRQGQVVSLRSLTQTPLNPDYINLADCLVRTWEFTPAQMEGQPVANSDLVVELAVVGN
ncbi:MAG TPA: hypothetical protein V6D20_20430 [Candidatus Obscuribacterales bacterium]